MPRLHEIIALTTARKPETQRKLTDLHQATQKSGLFSGLHKTYKPRDEADTETLPEERQEIQIRVSDVLPQVQRVMGDLYDLVAIQDTANQEAVADIVIGDKVVAGDVPVTTLLYLEKQLDDLKKFYATLPILDPAKSWQRDDDNRCFRSTTVKTRTKRDKVPVVLYEATDKHPAQVTLVDQDRIVGDYTSVETSGAITAADRTRLLERVSALADAVVTARERANQTETRTRKVGEALFKFLHDGIS